jgi:hypothetical protein
VTALTAAGQAAGATLAVVTAPSSASDSRFSIPCWRAFGGRFAFNRRRLRWRADQCVDRHVFALRDRRAGIHRHWLGLADLLLGDATGALLVTPLVFTFPTPWRLQTNRRVGEFIVLLALLIAASFLVSATCSRFVPTCWPSPCCRS